MFLTIKLLHLQQEERYWAQPHLDPESISRPGLGDCLQISLPELAHRPKMVHLDILLGEGLLPFCILPSHFLSPLRAVWAAAMLTHFILNWTCPPFILSASLFLALQVFRTLLEHEGFFTGFLSLWGVLILSHIGKNHRAGVLPGLAVIVP